MSADYDTATINHVRFDSDFTIVSNRILEETQLSWGAKSILIYILSRPAGWQTRTHQLSQVYKGPIKKGNGRESIRSAIKELMEVGYIKYSKTQNASGQWIHNYTAFPLKFDEFKKMFPERVIPDLVCPGLVNADVITSTELTRTELKKDKSKSKSKQTGSAPKPMKKAETILPLLLPLSLSDLQKRVKKLGVKDHMFTYVFKEHLDDEIEAALLYCEARGKPTPAYFLETLKQGWAPSARALKNKASVEEWLAKHKITNVKICKNFALFPKNFKLMYDISVEEGNKLLELYLKSNSIYIKTEGQ